MYEFTTEIASFRPPAVEQQVLLEAIADRPSEVSRFFGVLTGSVPMREYFSSRNVFRLIGLRGMAKVMKGRRRARSAA